MGKLDEYRKKRDFGKTPEPKGGESAPHASLAYVIQKHEASHLHFDFRIELDGVLLSWAVPKGPSLDPSVKRLAMHVEDHPIEYGGFEGVIPAGEYGGGTVMLWDRGTWEPDHGDPRQHLSEGHLKMVLHGERLKGRWMLVRSKGYGGSGKDSWLLFKERDDEVREAAEFDPVKEWKTSVATGRAMEDISSDEQAVWHSDMSVEENVAALSEGGRTFPVRRDVDPSKVKGAKKAKMPRSLDVELATLVKEAPEGDGWLHEIKFDGYRILAFKDGEKVTLISRNGHDWTTRFKPVAEAILSQVSAAEAIVDGEVVVLRPDGTTDFQALQAFARQGEEANLTYFTFDLLHLDGYDLRGASLEERKALLSAHVPSDSGTIRYTDHVVGHGDAFFDSACDYSLEGIVSKKRTAPYRSGRGKDWVKTKCLLRQEFLIVGWTEPGGSRKGFGSLVLGVHERGKLKHVGRVGTGFSDRTLQDLSKRMDPLELDKPPVSNPPKGAAARDIHWVKPQLVAEVEFTEWTEDEQLRHPSFVGLREDKPAEEVVPEKPSEAQAPPPAEEGAGNGSSAIEGVTITNPDRVLWPEAGITKLDLVRHYERVAEHMLPFVADRPLTLVRCPTGYTGECFYQKHIENFPKAVGTVDVYEPSEDVSKPYAVVRNLAGLAGLTQMGVLEIHTWGARKDDIERPDVLVFDLDPDAELPFEQVTQTAMLLRSELSRLGLESWVKTTGGKGLHVTVPVMRRDDWDSAKQFAKSFVDSIVAMEPRLFTSNMRMAKRGGRIFIDYLRNARGSTFIAPYSSRAKPGAPVAVPLRWDEIDGMKERPEYTVENVGKRLAALKGDPWEGFMEVRQSITKKARERLAQR